MSNASYQPFARPCPTSPHLSHTNRQGTVKESYGWERSRQLDRLGGPGECIGETATGTGSRETRSQWVRGEVGAGLTIPCPVTRARGPLPPASDPAPHIHRRARVRFLAGSARLSRSAQGGTLRPCIAAPMLPLRCVRSRCPRARECSPVARGPLRVKGDC
jgi:hypothetical protein